MNTPDYSPNTFLDTKNTLGSIRPADMTHPFLDGPAIAEFMAMHLLADGYVIRYDPDTAESILVGANL